MIDKFYSKKDFKIIKKLCAQKKPKYDKRIQSRKTLCLLKKDNKQLYDIIYNNNKLKKIISEIWKRKYNKDPSFPIEYRIYPKKSSGMRFHTDLSMFSPDCLELVLTLNNNSDSMFQWFESNKIKEIRPKENTLCIVKPNSVIHGVTSTGNGKRSILKFIIEFKNSKKKKAFYDQIKNCPT
tara:strand:+ start:1145 stop:1687 length:543 start_codon:yes stop_codon:yes gene_type:complete